jgi:uncharacterized membrane protein YkoI
MFTAGGLKTGVMPTVRVSPTLLLLTALAAGLAVPAAAADAPRKSCLSKAEQRAAVASHRAISLAAAIKSLHRGKRKEVVRARLCHRGGRLAYVLTVLARSGKVTRAVIDAATGEHIKGR